MRACSTVCSRASSSSRASGRTATIEGGIGINALTGADPTPPVGGAAFHDTAVWLRAEAAALPIAAE